ncbi:hypothetical protein AB0H00_19480 [Nocardia sp. NPDC023852]|uniref:hypothetical protein n=1 Tax=Nocardia sp. NPDC023852 TaxID=3154697 RepID=UPI0033FD76C2
MRIAGQRTRVQASQHGLHFTLDDRGDMIQASETELGDSLTYRIDAEFDCDIFEPEAVTAPFGSVGCLPSVRGRQQHPACLLGLSAISLYWTRSSLGMVFMHLQEHPGGTP